MSLFSNTQDFKERWRFGALCLWPVGQGNLSSSGTPTGLQARSGAYFVFKEQQPEGSVFRWQKWAPPKDPGHLQSHSAAQRDWGSPPASPLLSQVERDMSSRFLEDSLPQRASLLTPHLNLFYHQHPGHSFHHRYNLGLKISILGWPEDSSMKRITLNLIFF